MRTLESRLNEIERTLNADNGQGLPPFIYMSKYDATKDDEAKLIPEINDAFKKYQAEHQAEYPILKGLNYQQFMELLKKQGQIIHITFGDYSKEGAVC